MNLVAYPQRARRLAQNPVDFTVRGFEVLDSFQSDEIGADLGPVGPAMVTRQEGWFNGPSGILRKMTNILASEKV